MTNLINGYAHVEHNGRKYYVNPTSKVIYVRIAIGIMRDIKWDGPTGRTVRLLADADRFAEFRDENPTMGYAIAKRIFADREG